MLSTTHTPDKGAGPVVSHHLGRLIDQFLTHTRHVVHDVGRPFGNLFLDVIHSPDTLVDKFLVLPTILEDMPHHAPGNRHVCPGANLEVEVSMRSGTGKARIDHNERRVIALFSAHQVDEGNRMSLRRIAANNQHRLAVVYVVVRVGHRTVAPGIGHAGYRGGVTNSRLVVTVVRTPQGVELTEQVRLLVIEFGRPQPVNRIGAGLLSDLKHLVADLVDRIVPAHSYPFAANQFGGIFQATLTMPMFPHRCTFSAVGTQVKGVVKSRFLTHPDPVVDLGIDTATHRAVCAHRSYRLSSLSTGGDRGGVSLSHHGGCQSCCSRSTSKGDS